MVSFLDFIAFAKTGKILRGAYCSLYDMSLIKS